MKTRWIVAGSALVLATLLGSASHADPASSSDSSNLFLTLSLDRSEYEAGQPILAFVTVVNRGPSSFQARSSEVRCALDTMARKIMQKKFYYSYGP